MKELISHFTLDNSAARRLRVLMVVPQYPYPVLGGLERQSHELAKALNNHGVEVQVISGKTLPSQCRQERVEGILVHRIPWPQEKWVRFIRTPFDLLQILFNERHTYDVVHLHQCSWFALFVILVSKVLRKPVLTKMPNGGGMFGLPFLIGSRLGWLKLIVFKWTDAVVAITKDSLDELVKFGFPLSRILFSPNGVSMLKRNNQMKKSISGRDVCQVVFVGSIKEEKGVMDLLHAWRSVLDNMQQSVQLELWGSGPVEAEARMKTLCQDLHIGDSVIFRGHVESVCEKLEDMDVFVLPSISEGNSNAILEAMAAGLPVISTRVGGTPMQVGDEGARFLIEPGDRAGLCSCLLMLIENAQLRNEIGAAMRQRAITHFDIQKVATIYADAYAYLVAGRRDEVGKVNKLMIA